MLVLIGSTQRAIQIAQDHPDHFISSTELGFSFEPRNRYETRTRGLASRAGELMRHVIHPIPLGYAIDPFIDYALIKVTIAQLAHDYFESAKELTNDPFLRLQIVRHSEYLQLTVEPRARLVVEYNETGLLRLMSLAA